MALNLYYSTVGLLKPTLVTNGTYLNLVYHKNLNFPDFSCLFLLIANYDDTVFVYTTKMFESKMVAFDKFFEILPISGFRCKILISRLIFLVKIKKIRVNWCPRLGEL